MNKEEAELLTKHKGSIKELLIELYKLTKSEYIVVTNGSWGAMALYNNKFYYVPAKKLRVVDSTGAGDSFASTFTAMINQGFPIEEALRIAIINAESVIMHIGAKNGLLRMNDLLKRAKKDKRRIKVERLSVDSSGTQ